MTADATPRPPDHADLPRRLVDLSGDLLFTAGLDGRLTYVNDAFTRTLHHPAADLVGQRRALADPRGCPGRSTGLLLPTARAWLVGHLLRAAAGDPRPGDGLGRPAPADRRGRRPAAALRRRGPRRHRSPARRGRAAAERRALPAGLRREPRRHLRRLAERADPQLQPGLRPHLRLSLAGRRARRQPRRALSRQRPRQHGRAGAARRRGPPAREHAVPRRRPARPDHREPGRTLRRATAS